MEIFEIKEDIIFYNDMELHKSREFRFEGKRYIEFINYENHKFEIMKKLTDNSCMEITDKELKKRILEANCIKSSDIIE